jgi:hypothetical protein
MKKIILSFLTIAACSLTHATTINAPASLVGYETLDGNDAYEWGVSISTGGQTINFAELTFSNITLNVANSSGHGYLYTDLLKLNTTGVQTKVDNDAAGDYFKSALPSSSVTALGTNYFAKVGTTLSWTIILDTAELAALNSYVTLGTLSIGFDPDCHYSVGGISLTYTTTTAHTSVPDYGTTLVLLGISLCSLEFARRKFALAK